MDEPVVAPILIPDASPLITLAYAQSLDLLLKPDWPVGLVDMVLHEVTRRPTPTRDAIQAFISDHRPAVIETTIGQRHLAALHQGPTDLAPRKAGLGELAIQEAINQFARQEPPQATVLLFEDHKIASTSFFLPEGSLRGSTRAFLTFLEQRGWLASAAEIEQRALQAGRRFSQLRFP